VVREGTQSGYLANSSDFKEELSVSCRTVARDMDFLRGGPTNHMKIEDKYIEWKNLQTRAGKAVLQVSKPKAKPKVDFGDLDLDI
jgi:hypothetical protein